MSNRRKKPTFVTCEACEGTGLADRENGRQASKICSLCGGNGQVVKE